MIVFFARKTNSIIYIYSPSSSSRKVFPFRKKKHLQQTLHLLVKLRMTDKLNWKKKKKTFSVQNTKEKRLLVSCWNLSEEKVIMPENGHFIHWAASHKSQLICPRVIPAQEGWGLISACSVKAFSPFFTGEQVSGKAFFCFVANVNARDVFLAETVPECDYKGKHICHSWVLSCGK